MARKCCHLELDSNISPSNFYGQLPKMLVACLCPTFSMNGLKRMFFVVCKVLGLFLCMVYKAWGEDLTTFLIGNDQIRKDFEIEKLWDIFNVQCSNHQYSQISLILKHFIINLKNKLFHVKKKQILLLSKRYYRISNIYHLMVNFFSRFLHIAVLILIFNNKKLHFSEDF